MTRAMDRRLSQAREQNPEATYASIAGDYDQLLSALVDAETLEAFANKFGFTLSKRLIDAQIANIPAAKGLNGQFSEQSYAAFPQPAADHRRRSADDHRQRAASTVDDRARGRQRTRVGRNGDSLCLASAGSPRGRGCLRSAGSLPRGAEPHLRRRSRPSTRRTSAATWFLSSGCCGSPRSARSRSPSVQPSDKEIADYYNANRAQYAPKDTRTISQAVAPDQATANAIVQRLRSGQSFAAAAAPAGFTAQDIDRWSANSRAVHLRRRCARCRRSFRCDRGRGCRPDPVGERLARRQDRRDPARRRQDRRRGSNRNLRQACRRQAQGALIENIVNTVQDAIDEGGSFTEAAAAGKLSIVETPPVSADGRSRADPSYSPSSGTGPDAEGRLRACRE